MELTDTHVRANSQEAADAKERFAGDGGARPDRAAIEADIKLIHDAAQAAAAGKTGVLVLSSWDVPAGGLKATTKVSRFKLGDWKGMSAKAIELASEPLRNVYCGMHIMRDGLEGQQRGGLDDIVGVFGLVADIDADTGNEFDVDNLPLQPSLVLVTSSEPATNRQPRYFFDRLLPPDEAKPIAWGFCHLVGDMNKDTGDLGATADLAHVWRIAGTSSVPKPAKEKRGRPPHPQRVVAEGGTRLAVSTEDLIDYLEEALVDKLNGKTLAEAYRAATANTADPKSASTQQGMKRDGSRDENPENRWDGNPKKLARLVDALKHISPDMDRRTWLDDVVMPLHDYSWGDTWGLELCIYWSRGGGKDSFVGALHRFVEAEVRNDWDSLGDRPSKKRIGSLFRLAGLAGWDIKNIRRFGLRGRDFADRPVSAAAQLVRAVGASMPPLSLRPQALDAVRWLAAQKTDSAHALKMLDYLQGFINGEFGYAWVTVPTVAGHFGWSYEEVHRAAAVLEGIGVLVRNRADLIGARGMMEVTWTLRPPDGISWYDAVVWRRRVLGHTPDTEAAGLGILLSPAHALPEPRHSSAPASAANAQATECPGNGCADSSQPTPRHSSTPHYSMNRTREGEEEGEEGGERRTRMYSRPGNHGRIYNRTHPACSRTAPSAAAPLPPTTNPRGPSRTAPGRPLSDWLASGDLPPALANAMQAVATSRSKRPDQIIEKLNKLLAAGVSVGAISEELIRIEKQLAYRGRGVPLADLALEDQSKLLTKFFEKVTLFAADLGVDLLDAVPIRRRKVESQRQAALKAGKPQAQTSPAAGTTPPPTTSASDNVVPFGAHPTARRQPDPP